MAEPEQQSKGVGVFKAFASQYLTEKVSAALTAIVTVALGIALEWLRNNRGWAVNYFIAGAVWFLGFLVCWAAVRALRAAAAATAFYKRESMVDESNIDASLQKWAVDLGWSFRKIESPYAHFCAEVMHPKSNRHVIVTRLKNRPRYIRFQSLLAIPDQERAMLAASPGHAELVISQARVALARAGLWYDGLSVPPKPEFCVEHWIPVTRDLTEWEYIAAKDKLGAGVIEVSEIIKSGLRESASVKTQSTVQGG